MTTGRRGAPQGRARNLPGRDRARSTARRAADHNRSRDQWYRIVADRTRDGDGPTYAEVYIYDEIGYWGRTAQDLVDELASLQVDEIDLHLNSPGGEVWDGIAIYQALRDHPADICVYVDALAASIASVIAMAGDRVVMGRMAQMMIHDAWGLCIGNAGDMRQMADELDRFSNTIAGAYAERADGTVGQWRKAMLAETWYSPEEAVAAGLADAVAPKQDREDAQARHDLSKFPFRYAGRTAAPPPEDMAAANDVGGMDAPGGAGAGHARPTRGAPDPAGAATAPAAGGVVDPAAAPAVAEGDCTFQLPPGLDVAALFTGAIADAAAPPVIPIAGGDIAALIDHEANHRPATPTVTTRDPDTGPTTIDPIAFATALKEGLK